MGSPCRRAEGRGSPVQGDAGGSVHHHPGGLVVGKSREDFVPWTEATLSFWEQTVGQKPRRRAVLGPEVP